jgi:hypothetical protein
VYAVAADFLVGPPGPTACATAFASRSGNEFHRRCKKAFGRRASSKLLNASCRFYPLLSFDRCANGVGHVECLPVLCDRHGFAIARSA